MTAGGGDPFGTAAWRRTVLAGWAAAPTRFREDANAEEDHARGSYRDRLVVELAQNAADAATRAGVPGRLLLRLRDDELVAANTGHPLDAAGVAGLATLRASAKRDESGTIGRFGVGFAAVLAVTDEPRIGGRHGGVRFSAARTQAAVAGVASLHDELARRGAHVPVLRLPFDDGDLEPATVDAAAYDTVVVLPLRDDHARSIARDALRAVDDALLLALPGLVELVVEVDGTLRTLRARREDGEVVVTEEDDRRRWATVSSSGVLDAYLLRDRPVEERRRRGWSATWAVPVDDSGPRPDLSAGAGVAPVLHAPTPTDEPVSLPALLVATMPLEPGRRHVVGGPLADELVARAADGYADLVARLAAEHGATSLRLVPQSLPAGPFDARLQEAVLAALRARAFVPCVDGGPPMAPPDAVRLEPASPPVVRAVGSVRSGLADPAWRGPAMERLGSPLVPLSEALDELAGVARSAAWWRELYDALDAADLPPPLLEGLPVPLADGRVARGPRGVVCSDDPQLVERLAVLPGLRVAAEGLVHRLLVRLGAVADDPVALLSSDAVRAAVAGSLEAADPQPVCDAVLELVARSGAGQVPGLSELALPTQAGDWAAAGDLVLPSSPLAEVVAAQDDDVVSSVLLQRHPAEVLRAVGVADTFPVELVVDEPLDPEQWDAVAPDGEQWAGFVDDLLGGPALPPVVTEAHVVQRLDDVADEGWETAVSLLREGEVRDAVVSPVRVVTSDGAAHDVPSPAAWWLRDAPLLGGRRPVELRVPDADPVLLALYDAVPAPWADDVTWLRAVGVRDSLSDLLTDPDDVADLLQRLADPARAVGADALLQVYRALAALPEDRWPDPPGRVRVLAPAGSSDETDVVDAADATLTVSPLHVPVVGGGVLPGPPVLAELLDIATSSRWSEVSAPAGAAHPLPRAVSSWARDAAAHWVEHEDLVVGGVAVEAWVDPDGTPHAATTTGLARALAWQSGRWEDRHDVAELLADPAAHGRIRLDRAFDGADDADGDRRHT